MHKIILPVFMSEVHNSNGCQIQHYTGITIDVKDELLTVLKAQLEYLQTQNHMLLKTISG
jgi:hypothetical protein